MVWLLLFSCAGEPGASKAELTTALVTAEARIVELELEVEGYRRRMASIERLDAAMEKAHTHVGVRCTPISSEATGTSEHYGVPPAGWQEMLGDPEAVAAQGRWIPHGDIDQPKGWRLVRHNRGGLLDSCGLRTSDVLQVVNGISLLTEEGPQKAIEQASADGWLQIDVLRNRAPLTLSIQQLKD